jgi:hypothetical protein
MLSAALNVITNNVFSKVILSISIYYNINFNNIKYVLSLLGSFS